MTETLQPIVRLLSPQDVSPAGTHVIIEATEAQRLALAESAGIVSIEAMRAEVLVKPWSGNGFAVSGRITARVTQACVVSLEPLATTVDEPIDVKLVPPEEMEKYAIVPDEKGEIDMDLSTLDVPDPIENGVIDVGDIVREFFVLGLEPYPRKPGAVFDAAAAGVDPGAEVLSPFAALARLKKE